MDLFETPEKIPFDIQKILDRMNKRIEELEDTYKVLADALTECEKRGYTFEYGLDAVPFNLKPM